MAKRQSTAAVGKKLGRYVIERELGRGGMGIVYLAVDENLGRRVALKTTAVAGSGAASRNQRRARFVREVRALAQVSHSNVVHVFDAGETDDPDLGWLLHYSMEYVEGITLAQLVHRQGALAPDAAAAVCMQVAAGLGAAHKQGIIHRDVKPANIFLTIDGRALIGDFGICKIEGSTQITRRDQMVGTPNYLAPEQILGEDISPATDVFALGALFYVIATNSPMRARVDAAGLLQAAQTNESREKALTLKNFPDGLRKILAKALDRDPSTRFPTCSEFGDALSEFASKIPPLDDAGPKAEPTQDNMMLSAASGAFRSMVPPPDPAIPSGRASVEEMAQALLNQVGGDDVKPPKPKKPVLPVGKSESTVMFNLRQMEDEEAAASKEAETEAEAVDAPLPEARTESTMMFNIRQMEDEDAAASSPVGSPAPSETPPPAPARETPMPSVGGGAVTSSIGGPSSVSSASSPAVAPTTPTPAHSAQGMYSSVTSTPNGGTDAPQNTAHLLDAPAPGLADPFGPSGQLPAAAAAPELVVKSIRATDLSAANHAAPATSNLGKRLVLAAGSAFGGSLMAVAALALLALIFGGDDTKAQELIDIGGKKPVASVEQVVAIPSICAAATKTRSKKDASITMTRRAKDALAANRYSEAEKLARRAVELNPANQSAHYAMLQVFFKKGGGDVEQIKPHIICAYLLDKRSEMGVDAKRRLEQLQKR